MIIRDVYYFCCCVPLSKKIEIDLIGNGSEYKNKSIQKIFKFFKTVSFMNELHVLLNIVCLVSNKSAMFSSTVNTMTTC